MRYLPIIGLALAAALAGSPTNAEELTGTLTKIKETGAITIGFREASVPFSDLDGNRSPSASRWTLLQDRGCGEEGAQARQARGQAAAGHLGHPHPLIANGPSTSNAGRRPTTPIAKISVVHQHGLPDR